MTRALRRPGLAMPGESELHIAAHDADRNLPGASYLFAAHGGRVRYDAAPQQGSGIGSAARVPTVRFTCRPYFNPQGASGLRRR